MVLKKRIKVSDLIGLETFGQLMDISPKNLKEYIREISIFPTDVRRFDGMMLEVCNYIPDFIYEELSLYIYNILYKFDDVKILLVPNLEKTTSLQFDSQNKQLDFKNIREVIIEVKIADIKKFYKKNSEVLEEYISWKNLTFSKIEELFIQSVGEFSMEEFITPILTNIFRELLEF